MIWSTRLILEVLYLGSSGTLRSYAWACLNRCGSKGEDLGPHLNGELIMASTK